MKIKRFAMMLVLPVFGTTALAADLAVPSPGVAIPVAETPFSFAGAYFGAAVGYGWGSTSHEYIGGPGGGAPSGNSDPDGVLGGVYAGYNFQWNNIVVGFEGDIEAADLNGSYTDKSGITSTGSADMSWDASIRARLGAAFGRSLLYATGGIAFAGYDFEGGPLPKPVCCGYSDTLTGWTVGAGWDFAVAPRWITRFEYRYTDYGGTSEKLKPTYPGTKMRTENTTSVVRLGVAYKF